MRTPLFNDVDWKELGLKCGIEIHQQVLTDRKLFCRCPAGKYTDKHDAKVLRHMRPTLSELGEYDGTALMEFKTKKNIIYLLNRESVCTYEMDDTPPFEINRQAVDAAMEIALAFGCRIVGEMHVIRKQYLDGSIPTGFQRTMIIGVDGQIEVDGKTILITQVNLEEDSCREISDKGHEIVFRTDRLSMPLVEIITDASIKTPEEGAKVVNALSRTMRATGRVRRGAGATRQDVNVSVEGGTRVEIKGVPSISLIPGLVGTEGLRQRDLLRLTDWFKKTYTEENPIEFRKFDVTAILNDAAVEPMADRIRDGAVVKAVRIDGFGKNLSAPCGPHRTLADEIAGRMRVIACLDKDPIVIHENNREALGIDGGIWRAIRRRGRVRSNDALILIHGSEADVNLGLDEIIARVNEIPDGIPNETRQVDYKGSTDFERILPGPDRMYPDTDSPPMSISDEWLDDVRSRAIEPVASREKRLADDGLPPDVIDDLAISTRLADYDKLSENGVSRKRAGVILSQTWKHLNRKGITLDAVDKSVLFGLFHAAEQGKITYESLPLLLKDAAKNTGKSATDLVSARGLEPLKGNALKKAVEDALKKVAQPATQLPESRARYFMGELMPQFLGCASGKEVLQHVTNIMGV